MAKPAKPVQQVSNGIKLKFVYMYCVDVVTEKSTGHSLICVMVSS